MVAALYSGAAFLAYTWYNQKEKRLRITLIPHDGIDIQSHMESISSNFSPGKLPTSIRLKGYHALTSHIEVRKDKVIITVDIKYTWKATWDIGSLWIPGFDISLSEIYDR